jgi:basic amino acid/polyamine antiporter, APA family
MAASLVRELKLSHTGAIVVGTIIGSGIFLVPREMMQAVGSAKLVYLAWIVGGLLSFFGALTYAELGAMKPEAGGEYVYVRDAYGPLTAFLWGWTWFLLAKPASIASICTGLVRILGTFPSLASFTHAWITHPFTITYGEIAAALAAVLLSGLNYVGVKYAGRFQFYTTLAKVAMIVAVVAIGFSFKGGTWANFGTTFIGSKGGIAGFFAALVAALWAYDGWNDLNMVAGEIDRPQRNIPLSLIWGVATVGALYILVNAAVQYVLPATAMAGAERPASQAVELALGPMGAGLLSAGVALSMLVALNGTIMSGARIPYAMAKDGYFFKALANVHPKFRTPSSSIVVQCVLSVALLLTGGSFKQFFSLAIFSEWLFYMIAGSSIFIFRMREPQAERPYKVWGYPVVPAAFVAASAVLLYYTFVDNFRASLWGSIAILLGVPVFYAFKSRRVVHPAEVPQEV